MEGFSFLDSNFYEEKSVLTAKKIVEWKRKRCIYNFTSFPKTVIISAINCFAKKELFFKKKIKGLNCKAHQINSVLWITNFGNGAPSVVSLMEELKELGVEKFIFIGFAGTLMKTINSGTIFNVNEAYSLNGTSYFYTKNSKIKNQNNFQNKIVSLLKCEEKITLSVDMPFRETPNLLIHYKNKKATLVDMETASILAFGNYHKVSVAVILIASDVLLPNWKVPKNIENIKKKVKKKVLKLSNYF